MRVCIYYWKSRFSIYSSHISKVRLNFLQEFILCMINFVLTIMFVGFLPRWSACRDMMQQHVAHWYTSQNIVFCCITHHKAQNTRYVLSFMQEYLQYIYAQFLEGLYHCCHSIINIDEKKIYFEMEDGLTLGSWYRFQNNQLGSNMCCTVLLDVSMSGEKCASLVVFKGVMAGIPGSNKNLAINILLFSHRWCIGVKQRRGLMSRLFIVDSRHLHPTILPSNGWFSGGFDGDKPQCTKGFRHWCGLHLCSLHLQLQVLDVRFNKPLKDFFRDAYEN